MSGGDCKLIHVRHLDQSLGRSKYSVSIILFFLNEMNNEVSLTLNSLEQELGVLLV